MGFAKAIVTFSVEELIEDLQSCNSGELLVSQNIFHKKRMTNLST